jgi:hypothetical protein
MYSKLKMAVSTNHKCQKALFLNPDSMTSDALLGYIKTAYYHKVIAAKEVKFNEKGMEIID